MCLEPLVATSSAGVDLGDAIAGACGISLLVNLRSSTGSKLAARPPLFRLASRNQVRHALVLQYLICSYKANFIVHSRVHTCMDSLAGSKSYNVHYMYNVLIPFMSVGLGMSPLVPYSILPSLPYPTVKNTLPSSSNDTFTLSRSSSNRGFEESFIVSSSSSAR